MQAMRLPYIDNAKAVFITLAINLGVIFLFNWPDGITYSGVMWDSLFCAIITTTINMWIVYPRLKRMRALGEIPAQAPESRFMQRLPQNPIALGVIYAVVFAALAVGINAVLLWFFGIEDMAFAPWAVYKLLYATVLSIKIVECCIFRYVQPDWAKAGHYAQAETGKELPGRTVRNPLPKIGLFKEMFGSVTGNIAMNIIIGSVLGGVAVEPDGSVVILPTTVEGIPITGLVFGLIVGILVTNGVVTAMNAAILASHPAMPAAAVTDKRLAWMPRGRVALTCFVSICLMLFSAAALRAVLTLFGISLLNFYQFTVFITVYASILSKPLSFILTKRCAQPDYIRYILKKGGE
jgi:hypothetical protein